MHLLNFLHQIYNRRNLLILAGAAVLILGACGQPTAVESPAPTSETTSTPLPSETPLPTETLVPSPTPTRTLRPTHTATPLPSPTPKGYYDHTDGAFHFTYPATWETDQEDEFRISVYNTNQQISFYALSFQDSPNYSLDEFIPFWFEGTTIASQSDPFEVTLADGLVVTAKDVKVNIQDTDFVFRIAFYNRNGQIYVPMFYSWAPGGFEGRQATMERIYTSFTPYIKSAFDTPRSETLTLLGYDPNPEDLDPAEGTSGASDFTGLLYSGLVRQSPNLQIEPDLAESWTIDSTGTVYTFTLRAEAAFADGTLLTSADVVYSWERAANPDTNSPSVKTYLGDIVGVQDVMDGETETIAGLKIIDDRTLQVTIDASKPYFLLKLTFPTSFIVNRKDVEDGGDEWMYEPNGSGPYILSAYDPTVSLTFEPNPYYHTPPSIRYVAYIINPGGSAISRYEDGTLDWLYVGGETALRVRRPDDELHADLLSTASLCTSYVAMNNSLPPFDDPNVRRAFLLAVDRDIYLERITRNLDLPALTIYPPAMPGFNNEHAVPAYDPEAAKAALAASKYAENMPEIVIETGGYGVEPGISVNALVEMWRRTLGVDVRVLLLDPINYTEAARENPAHMSIAGWCADYADPQNFTEPLFKTGAEFNDAGYSNPEVDALIDQAGVERDVARRLAMYQDIEKMLLDDTAVIPLQHNVFDVLVGPRLKGFVLSPLNGAIIPYLSIEP